MEGHASDDSVYSQDDLSGGTAAGAVGEWLNDANTIPSEVSPNKGNVDISRSSFLKSQIDDMMYHGGNARRNSNKGVIRDMDDDGEEMMEQEKLSDASHTSAVAGNGNNATVKENEMVAIPVVGSLSNGSIRKRS